MSFNVVITLLMFVVIIVLLLKGIGNPGIIFVGVPIIAALIMGFSLKQINGFIGSGLSSVSGIIFLFVFAVLYFGMLHDAGVFKTLIRWVTRLLKNNIPSTMIVATIISMLTQLDASGATTALCTIPSMRPLFERQHIRVEALLLIETIGSGVLLYLPYMPGFNESCTYIGVDVNEAYQFMLPVMIFNIVLAFLMVIPIAIREKRNGAGMTDEEFQAVKAEMMTKVEYPLGKGVAIFDGIFTLVLVLLILFRVVPTNFGFGLGFAIMIFVNYPSAKAIKDYFSRNASTCLAMAFTMLGIGVLVGINNGSGAVAEFAVSLTGGLSASAAKWILPIACFLGVPASMIFGASGMMAVIFPAITSILATVGYVPVQVIGPLNFGFMVSSNLNLFNASPYLALGLAGVEMKDHLKYSFLTVWIFSIISTIFMIIIGRIPL